MHVNGSPVEYHAALDEALASFNVNLTEKVVTAATSSAAQS